MIFNHTSTIIGPLDFESKTLNYMYFKTHFYATALGLTLIKNKQKVLYNQAIYTLYSAMLSETRLQTKKLHILCRAYFPPDCIAFIRC